MQVFILEKVLELLFVALNIWVIKRLIILLHIWAFVFFSQIITFAIYFMRQNDFWSDNKKTRQVQGSLKDRDDENRGLRRADTNMLLKSLGKVCLTFGTKAEKTTGTTKLLEWEALHLNLFVFYYHDQCSINELYMKLLHHVILKWRRTFKRCFHCFYLDQNKKQKSHKTMRNTNILDKSTESKH